MEYPEEVEHPRGGRLPVLYSRVKLLPESERKKISRRFFSSESGESRTDRTRFQTGMESTALVGLLPIGQGRNEIAYFAFFESGLLILFMTWRESIF